jgi:hypothetical protein
MLDLVDRDVFGIEDARGFEIRNFDRVRQIQFSRCIVAEAQRSSKKGELFQGLAKALAESGDSGFSLVSVGKWEYQ